MKPNYLKTLEERQREAKRYDSRYLRPDSEDYAWHDGDRSGTQPREDDTVSQHSVPVNPKVETQ